MPHSTEEIVTAYHEAGHAVMALALGRPVHAVSIEPDRVRLGHCEIRKGTFRPNPDALETAILILLGGPAAETLHQGDYCEVGARQDLREVQELAEMRAAGPKQVEKLQRRLMNKADAILSRAENWRAVERIARELLERRVISGRSAHHLFDLETRNVEER